MGSAEVQPAARPTVPASKMAVLVLGAPRSGTSALSQVLSGLGVYFGEAKEFVDPVVHKHNPIFFELQSLNDINNALLASIDVNFGDFDYLPAEDALPLPRMAADAARARVDQLIAQQLDMRVAIGLKDPRFVYTLPFWDVELRRLGYEPRYVLAMRGADAVIESNRKVNGRGREHNVRLAWLSSALSALQLAGKDYISVDFDRLLSDPSGTAAMLQAWLGLAGATPSEAVGSIDVRLRHEESGFAAFVDGQRGVETIAVDYLDFRRELETRGVLELIERRRLEAHGFARALAAAQAQRAVDVDAAMGAASSMKAAMENLTAGLAREREVSREAVEVMKARFDVESASARELYERRVADLESAIFERDAQLMRLEHAKAELARAAERVEGQVKQLESALVGRDAQLQEVQALIRERDAQLMRLEHAKAELARAAERVEGQVKQLESALVGRDAQLQEVQALIRERDESILGLERERQRLSGVLASLQADCDLMRSAALESHAAHQQLQAAMTELVAERQFLEEALAKVRRPWYRKLFNTQGRTQEQ